MSEFKTVKEVAIALRVQPTTIRTWLKTGELTGLKTSAGWRISDEDVEGWLNFHRERRYRLSQGLSAQPND